MTASQPGQYRKVEIRRFPARALRETAEGRYWRAFQPPLTAPQAGAVTHLDVCPTAPYHFAATASTRVRASHNLPPPSSRRLRMIERCTRRLCGEGGRMQAASNHANPSQQSTVPPQGIATSPPPRMRRARVLSSSAVRGARRQLSWDTPRRCWCTTAPPPRCTSSSRASRMSRTRGGACGPLSLSLPLPCAYTPRRGVFSHVGIRWLAEKLEPQPRTTELLAFEHHPEDQQVISAHTGPAGGGAHAQGGAGAPWGQGDAVTTARWGGARCAALGQTAR
jgi:hypothetical protein